MKTLKYLFACFLVIAFASVSFAAPAGPTLLRVQGSKVLKVGIRAVDQLGMIEHLSSKSKLGMEADIAKAIAAAVDVSRIEWVPCGLTTRFSYLDDETVDVTVRTVTLTSRRDSLNSSTNKGYTFGPIYFFDGTNVILHPDRIPASPINIIVANGSSNQRDIDTFTELPAGWNVVYAYESALGADDAAAVAGQAFDDGEYTDPNTGITYVIHGFCGDGVACNHLAKSLDLSVDLEFDPPISKSPLAIMIKEGDDNWTEVVSWVFYALVAAEEAGYTSTNLPPYEWGPKVEGLNGGWAREVINKVGNYEEIWDRNFGGARGKNSLYIDDGLLYAPPF